MKKQIDAGELAELKRRALNAKGSPLISVSPALILDLLAERQSRLADIDASLRVTCLLFQEIRDEREGCAVLVDRALSLLTKETRDPTVTDAVALFTKAAADIRARGKAPMAAAESPAAPQG